MGTSPFVRATSDSSTAAADEGRAANELDGFQERGPDFSKYVTAIILLIVVVAFVVTVDGLDPTTQKPNLRFEFAKFMMQLAVVVLAGHFLVDQHQRRRSKKLAANDFRKFLLRSLTSAYTGTKKARRLLRASCVAADGSPGIPFDLYEKQMTSVNDVQLELEVLAGEVKIFSTAFSDVEGAKEVFRKIDGMEKYLGELITEFEGAKQSVGNEVSSACLKVAAEEGLRYLHGFIRRREAGTFHARFSEPYDAAIKVILEEGLKV